MGIFRLGLGDLLEHFPPPEKIMKEARKAMYPDAYLIGFYAGIVESAGDKILTTAAGRLLAQAVILEWNAQALPGQAEELADQLNLPCWFVRETLGEPWELAA